MESARLQALYLEMCRRMHWKPAGWNAIAGQVRNITGARKTYRWFRLDNGEPHRLRVHPIPKQTPSTRVVPIRRAEPAARSAA